MLFIFLRSVRESFGFLVRIQSRQFLQRISRRQPCQCCVRFGIWDFRVTGERKMAKLGELSELLPLQSRPPLTSHLNTSSKENRKRNSGFQNGTEEGTLVTTH